MKSRTSSRTGLFLMELILAVLLFSLASILCIQMFVKSHTLSKSSVELNHSILWAQNVSEAFYGCNGNASAMSGLFEGCYYEIRGEHGECLTLLFDENFCPIEASADTLTNNDYSYELTALITQKENGLLSCSIWVTEISSKYSIYDLTLSLFPDKEVPYES